MVYDAFLRVAVAEVVWDFLRLRQRASLPFKSPLQAVHWDGALLNLSFDAGFQTAIALDVEGCFFSIIPISGEATARFAFAFSPSGRAAFDVVPRLGRDGAALTGFPLHLHLGVPGFDTAAPGTVAEPLAQLQSAQLVPYGADVGAPEVVVVVPVYNASDLVARCLDAVLAHTSGRARLVVIDDASTDPLIAPLLARYAGIAGVSLMRNDHNRGFTATANRGIELAQRADVVLLNADAEVGPNWLPGLRRAAHVSSHVGTVTAVSDNAGAFSVPELEQANVLPALWSFEACARALWQSAGLAYPELPTGNGFCLYMRRAVIDAVGLLDERAFAQGYGEENDFCQRAARHGFRHLIAGNVLVRHARSQSFGEQRRRALGRAGMSVLRERYPDYENDVGNALFSFERRALDWRVRRLFGDTAADNEPKPRVLWVTDAAPHCTYMDIFTLRGHGSSHQLALGDAVVAISEDDETSPNLLWDWLQRYAIECLLVHERTHSGVEVLCGLLDIPIVCVNDASVSSACDTVRDALIASRSFSGVAS